MTDTHGTLGSLKIERQEGIKKRGSFILDGTSSQTVVGLELV